MELKIMLDVGGKQGAYITVTDSSGAESEYLIQRFSLNYLFPAINSALRDGVCLSGGPVNLFPPNDPPKE
jgi:hypothetical protein